MPQEIPGETGESQGVIARVALDLGVGDQALRGWVNRAKIGFRPTHGDVK